MSSVSGMGIDRSGNGNHWASNNLATSDQMLDSPTNNFCTLNSIYYINTGTNRAIDVDLAQGNCRFVGVNTGNNQDGRGIGTMYVSSGKWYWEGITTTTGGNVTFGLTRINGTETSTFGASQNTGDVYYMFNNGDQNIAGSQAAYGASYAQYDVIGTALDFTANSGNGTLTFYKNGVSQGVVAGFNLIGYEWTVMVSTGASNGYHGVMNFGQDATFAGEKSPSTAYNDGKYGSFYYQPPSGFKALCTLNLSDPTIKPGEHFNALTYPGDSATNRAITGVGFQPDFVWFKQRDITQDHLSFDSVRGTGYRFKNNTSASEAYHTTTLKSFDSDGFTVGDATAMNNSSGTYVSWNWKAGGTAASNTNGSITSSVSANTNAGFSVVSYTGNGTSGATVGHGLSSAPEMVIYKTRSHVEDWYVYNENIGLGYKLKLNSTLAKTSSSNEWTSAPSSTLLTHGSGGGTNGSSKTYIAYCFHSVDGFSKIGSYSGNGNADGSFVWTGFQPKWILFKQIDIDGENWRIIDDARNPYNQANKHLAPSNSYGESTESGLDFLSNGFKFRHADAHQNGSGATYFYMAFAEFPFKYANAR